MEHYPFGVDYQEKEIHSFDGDCSPSIIIRQFGVVEYLPIWQAMKNFTSSRGQDTPDEIWLLQHPPIYTVGLNGKAEHFPKTEDIPVIKIDRGGQITYHGPGQAIAYLLLDMHRRQVGVRELVRKMEHAVIDLLADYGIPAEGRESAPGVYIHGSKIAALGLKISKGCCYHGIAFNVDMDLSPFLSINPCGSPGLKVTQARDVGITDSLAVLSNKLGQKLVHQLEHRKGILS